MAKKRDVVIAVIIAVSFVIAIGFFGLIVIGLMSEGTGEGFARFGEKIGVIEVSGAIDEGNGRRVIYELDRWADNSSIKAIVLHINSPGGGVAISQEIYDAILRLKERKPVVASMGSVAASGGYYVACGADRIMADPGTITGSIGVIFQFYEFEGLMDKVGVALQTVKSGEMKDVGSPDRPLTKKEELMLQSVVMDSYEQFVDVVATGRGMEKEEVYPLADGSIFTGLQAMNLGLVDTLGGLYEAVDLAADLAGVRGEPSVVRPYRREKVSIFDFLGSFLGDLHLPLDKKPAGPQLLYLYQ